LACFAALARRGGTPWAASAQCAYRAMQGATAARQVYRLPIALARARMARFRGAAPPPLRARPAPKAISAQLPPLHLPLAVQGCPRVQAQVRAPAHFALLASTARVAVRLSPAPPAFGATPRSPRRLRAQQGRAWRLTAARRRAVDARRAFTAPLQQLARRSWRAQRARSARLARAHLRFARRAIFARTALPLQQHAPRAFFATALPRSFSARRVAPRCSQFP
jgi:hypothetical protein